MIYTFTGKEQSVADRIQEFVLRPGEEVYIPTYNRQRKYNGAYRIVNAILFPGYIFYETEEVGDLKERLKKVIDVTKLLQSDNYVLPLSSEEEVLLYKLCGKEHVLDISTGYFEGQSVRVISGPLMGQEARIRKIDRHKRIAHIEIELLHRKLELTVGLEIIY